METYLKYTTLKGDCMVWTRCCNTDGYPRALIRGSANGKVHREVFFVANGYYPPVVRHTCDNIKCINPAHLLGGTASDNMEDRQQRGRTHNFVAQEEVETIKALKAEGLTHKQISIKLNVNPKRVEYVLLRKGG